MKKVLSIVAIALMAMSVAFAQENNNRDENGNIVRGPYLTNEWRTHLDPGCVTGTGFAVADCIVGDCSECHFTILVTGNRSDSAKDVPSPLEFEFDVLINDSVEIFIVNAFKAIDKWSACERCLSF